MNKFGRKLSCFILMKSTQITKHSLTDKNYCLINFVKITTICLKFPLSPRLPISPSIFFENETALPLIRGEQKGGSGSCENPVMEENRNLISDDWESPALAVGGCQKKQCHTRRILSESYSNRTILKPQLRLM